jgi:hypothetical protein
MFKLFTSVFAAPKINVFFFSNETGLKPLERAEASRVNVWKAVHCRHTPAEIAVVLPGFPQRRRNRLSPLFKGGQRMAQSSILNCVLAEARGATGNSRGCFG